MTFVLKYDLRLGDIVACLPIADALAQQGHEVLFWCREEYHDIFRCVSYCKPISIQQPGLSTLVDIQVWPARYNDYRASGKPWQQYVYELAAHYTGIGLDIHTPPRFTDTSVDLDKYGLVSGEYDLVAPYGISQEWRPSRLSFIKQIEAMGMHPQYKVLTPPYPAFSPSAITARKLSDLPGLIQHARKFLTTESAPHTIAAGVRKEWHYFKLPDYNGQEHREYAGGIAV